MAACQGSFFSVFVPSTVNVLAASVKDPFNVVVSALQSTSKADVPQISLLHLRPLNRKRSCGIDRHVESALAYSACFAPGFFR